MIAEFPEKLQFLFEPARYKVAWGGRGGAKSWNFARALLLLGTQKPLRILCARETQNSIDESVHQLLEDQIKKLGLESFYRVEKRHIYGSNESEFFFAGLRHNIDNIKSLESADIVWVEEAHTVSKDSWDKLIPTLRKDGSEIWISFNPDLAEDETYRRFVLNPASTAKVVRIGWADNPWFPETLRVEAEELALKDPESWAHIYGGDCRTSVEGAIFAAELKQAMADGRITKVPYNRTRPVDTAWDLGFGDLTSIWFFQTYDGWFHFIDYLQDEGKTITDYVIQLQQRGYAYGVDWLPHDGVDTIIHRKLAGVADRSMSIEMLMRQAGRHVRLAPKLYITDRINAARTVFPQCRFDSDKCADGLSALRRYQWGPLPDNGVRRREPLHDDASHGADAFQAAAVAARQPKAATSPKKPAMVPVSAWS